MPQQSFAADVQSIVDPSAHAYRERLHRQIAQPFHGTAYAAHMTEVAERCASSLGAQLNALVTQDQQQALEVNALASLAKRSLGIRIRVTDSAGSEIWRSEHFEAIRPSPEHLVTGLVPRRDGLYSSFLPHRDHDHSEREIPAEYLVYVPLSYAPFDLTVSAERDDAKPGQGPRGRDGSLAVPRSTGRSGKATDDTLLTADAASRARVTGLRPLARVINAEEVMQRARHRWTSALGTSDIAQRNIESVLESLQKGMRSTCKAHDRPKGHSHLEETKKEETYWLTVGARTVYNHARKEYIPCPAWSIYIKDGKDSRPIASSYTHAHRLRGGPDAPTFDDLPDVMDSAALEDDGPAPPSPMEWAYEDSSGSSLSSPDSAISPPPALDVPSITVAHGPAAASFPGGARPGHDTTQGGGPPRTSRQIGLKYEKEHAVDKADKYPYWRLSGEVTIMSGAEFDELREQLAQDGTQLPIQARRREPDIHEATEQDLGDFLKMLTRGRRPKGRQSRNSPPEDITLTIGASDTVQSLVTRWQALWEERTPEWSAVNRWNHWQGSGDRAYYDNRVADAKAQAVDSFTRELTKRVANGSLATGTTIVPGVCFYTEGKRRSVYFHTWRLYAPSDVGRTQPIAQSIDDSQHVPTLLRTSRNVKLAEQRAGHESASEDV